MSLDFGTVTFDEDLGVGASSSSGGGSGRSTSIFEITGIVIDDGSILAPDAKGVSRGKYDCSGNDKAIAFGLQSDHQNPTSAYAFQCRTS